MTVSSQRERGNDATALEYLRHLKSYFHSLSEGVKIHRQLRKLVKTELHCVFSARAIPIIV